MTKFTAGLSASTVMGSAGPDGNIWFLETHKVGKITPAGVITEYSAGLNAGNSLFRMGSEGPDGNMWFSDRGTTKAIGRITPDGTITEFSTGLNPGSNPGRLQSGPDGNMWFVDQGTTEGDRGHHAHRADQRIRSQPDQQPEQRPDGAGRQCLVHRPGHPEGDRG